MLIAVHSNAQNFGQILGEIGKGILQGASIGTVLKNPNLQSADMRNFFAFVSAGNQSYNAGKYGDAVSHYGEARKIASRTSDNILKQYYNDMGAKNELDQLYNNAYTQYKLQNPSVPSSSGLSPNTIVGSPSMPTQTPIKCGVCGGSGRCRTCGGRGISYVGSGHICGACGGKGNCYTCNGRGISGYITNY